MNTGLADQIVDERNVVHDGAEVAHDVTDQLAATAIRLELPDRFHPWAQPILECLDVLAEVALLPVALHQFGLEVEQVDVARRPRHK